VVSLPINNNHSSSEGKRLSFQLFALRENVAFKKLGIYGRKRPRKNNTQKPTTERVSLAVNKSDSPPLLGDEVLPTALPDLPKPVNKDDEPPALSSTNNR